MKITFLGLSAFLIESSSGDRILLDPFDDAAEYQLGVSLPKDLEADLVLCSHKDPDHFNPSIASKKPELANQYLISKVTGNEFNGDEFNIHVLKIDGITIAHFADQSVPLSNEQISQLGQIDIAIYSPPKPDFHLLPEALEVARANIEKITPKIVIWSHYITPDGWQEAKSEKELRKIFREHLAQTAVTNKNYSDGESFMELCYILENGLRLNEYFSGKACDSSSNIITKLPEQTEACLFAKMSN